MKPPTTDDDALSDAELLAFLLRNDHSLADDLLARFGSLREVLHTDPGRLVAEPGIEPRELALVGVVGTQLKHGLRATAVTGGWTSLVPRMAAL